MSDETDLADVLQRRTAAWARVNGTVTALRASLAEKPIAKRVKDHAADRVIDAVDSAKAVAGENRLVIGGVVALLAGWFLRGPIIRTVQGWFGHKEEAE